MEKPGGANFLCKDFHKEKLLVQGTLMEVKIDQHMIYQWSLSSGHLMNERRKMIDLNVEGTTIQSPISIIFIDFFFFLNVELLKFIEVA